MSDDRRDRYRRDQESKSGPKKVLIYLGWLFIVVVVAFLANLVLGTLCLQPGSQPCG